MVLATSGFFRFNVPQDAWLITIAVVTTKTSKICGSADAPVEINPMNEGKKQRKRPVRVSISGKVVG